MATQFKQFKLEDVCRAVSSRNDLIKGKQIQEFKQGLYPAFSATGQDIWREEFEHEGVAIIVSAVGARCGKCFRADGEWTAIANTHIIFPKEKINRNYLFYHINNENFWGKGGLAQPFVKIRDTLRRKTIPIPVDSKGNPDIREQERIVALLEEAGKLKKKRVEADQKMNEVILALFMQMFGDPNSNSMKWRKVPLGKVAKVEGGFAFKSSLYKNIGIPLVRIANITSHGMDMSQCVYIDSNYAIGLEHFILKQGDILIAMSGATTGKSAIVRPEMLPVLVNQRVGRYKILSGEVISTYLFALIKSSYYQKALWKFAVGGAQPNVSPGQLESIPMPIPPISLQEEFAETVKEVLLFQEKQKQSAINIDALFSSLLSRAFI